MRILKNILIVIVVIVLIAVVVGMFLPSQVHIEKTLVLQAPQEAVFKQVVDLKNWNSWMPFNKMDPSMKQTFCDQTEGIGACYSWESEKMGNGKVTITEDKPNESVVTNLDFGKNGSANSLFTMNKEGSGTKVVWGFDQDMGGNPFKRIMGSLVMPKMMGGIFEKGLMSLDSAAMAMPMSAPVMPADTTILTAEDSNAAHQ